jgi:hypothetical protein
MAFECSKRVRGLLRQLAQTAYERELRILLDELGNSFHRFRQGEVDTWDLVNAVDRFARGPDRHALETLYETSNSVVHMIVAQAIARGILTREEVPAEVLKVLTESIDFYEQSLADGTVRFDQDE